MYRVLTILRNVSDLTVQVAYLRESDDYKSLDRYHSSLDWNEGGVTRPRSPPTRWRDLE